MSKIKDGCHLNNRLIPFLVNCRTTRLPTLLPIFPRLIALISLLIRNNLYNILLILISTTPFVDNMQM